MSSVLTGATQISSYRNTRERVRAGRPSCPTFNLACKCSQPLGQPAGTTLCCGNTFSQAKDLEAKPHNLKTKLRVFQPGKACYTNLQQQP